MENEKVFESPDVYLVSAVVVLLKKEPSYIVRDRRTFFRIPVSDELYHAMALYNAGVKLPAFEYAETIKRLRGEAIARRHSGGADGR